MPYPTGRFFRGTLSQALRARLRSVLSLRDALADISQQHLASAHKCLRICDLCQELAFGTQRGLSQSCNSYNSFVFIVLWRQFLERCCCEMSASASRRDNTDRSLARSAWESVPRKNRPVGYNHRIGAHTCTNHTVPYGTALWGGAVP